MSANGINIAFGGATFLSGTVDEVKEWLDVLDEFNISRIDTAERYGASEELLGKVGAASKFIIDTKFSGAVAGELATKEEVLSHGKESLRKLDTGSVDIYYLHAPDRKTSIKDTLSGLNELYQQGSFKRLGLSNFLAEEVEEAVSVAKENNFVVPSVYQGNYNAISRRADTEIFPTVRKHGMAFYAYSPIAGGFLAKSKAGLFDPQSRFHKDHPLSQLMNGLYNRPISVAALDDWERIAQDEGISRSELAYRWVVYHSKLQKDTGDAIIVGARNVQQLKETLQFVQAGPLKKESVKKVDEIWERVKSEAGLDHLN